MVLKASKADSPELRESANSHLRAVGGTGHELREPESDARAGGDSRGAREAVGDSLWQRAGTNEPAFSGVMHRTADRTGAYSTKAVDAEPARREFACVVAG